MYVYSCCEKNFKDFFHLFSVTIEGEFRALVIQARSLVDNRQDEVVGSWRSYPRGMEVTNCTNNHQHDTMVYAGDENMNNVYFQWIAPEDLKSAMQFV